MTKIFFNFKLFATSPICFVEDFHTKHTLINIPKNKEYEEQMPTKIK